MKKKIQLVVFMLCLFGASLTFAQKYPKTKSCIAYIGGISYEGEVKAFLGFTNGTKVRCVNGAGQCDFNDETPCEAGK